MENIMKVKTVMGMYHIIEGKKQEKMKDLI
jgi:hypothetical protein